MGLPSVPLQETVRFRRSQAGFEFPGIHQAGDLLQGVQRRRDGVSDHGSGSLDEVSRILSEGMAEVKLNHSIAWG